MSEDSKEEKLVKPFLVKCNVEHASSGEKDFFLDVVDGVNEEDAKDFVVGYLAEKDYIVKDWVFVRDAERLRDLVRIVSR